MGEVYRLFPSVRLCMVLFALIATTVLGGGFSAFNFAIVCMVNETAITAGSPARPNASRGQCDLRNVTAESEIMGYGGEFAWNRATQANLLAAHAYGALLMNVPSGLLSDRYGSKLVIAACVLANGIANAVTPIAAYAGTEWVFVARVIQGFGYGASWPAVFSMITRWSAASEAGLFLSLSTIGYQMGTLIAMVTSSNICDSSFGWPFIFYLWGGLSAAFVVAWLILYTDYPDKCKCISRRELDYLEKFKMRTSESGGSFWRIPWKKLLFSPCAVATHLCQFSYTWSLYYICEYLPTYSKEVLLFDVRSNGITSALPALTQAAARTLLGSVADKITFFGRSKTFSVKLFTVLANLLPALCFVSVGFLDCRHATPAVVAFSLASALMGANTVSFGRGGVLMAPQYSGAVASISNCYGDFAAVVMPYVVGVMTVNGTVPEWQHTAWLTACILAVTFVIYEIFGTAKEQKWATEKPTKKSANKIYMIDCDTKV